MVFLAFLKRKISPEVRSLLLLFIVSRIILTLVGVSSRIILEPVYGKWHEWNYSKHLWLDIWGIWDSGWYLDIAQNGYSMKPPSELPKKVGAGQVNFGFFPLYPLLIKILGTVIKDSFLAGIIVSNVFLLIACVFLYKLVAENDKGLAHVAVKYLFLFPTAFILSGVFSESLFLALLIMCFYYSKKKKWFLVGILGFFLSLARPPGAIVFLPLLYEYLKQKRFLLKKVKPEILYLIFIPLGLLSFMVYSYSLTGDFFAYYHVKQSGWGVGLTNPLSMLVRIFLVKRIDFTIIGTLILSEMFLLTAFYKKIDFSRWLLAFSLLIIPLMTGVGTTISIPRLSVVIFPFFILLAKLAKKGYLDYLLTVFMALFQGFLFVYWVNGALIV